MAIINESVKSIIKKHFFDFFMLFMAVSLGFMVDNYRDQVNSDKLANDLADDLSDDIVADTVAIQDLMSHCKLKEGRLDTLYSLVDIESPLYNDTLIYRYSSYVARRVWFERHSSTFTLLLNAGYLSNLSKDVSVAITSYDNECKKLISYLDQERQTLNAKIYPFLQHIFHTENFISYLESGAFVCKPELLNWNAENRWLFLNYITELRLTNDIIFNHYQHLITKASITLKLLQAEYNIAPSTPEPISH